MTERLSADRLAELRGQLKRAHDELGEVCEQGLSRRFVMRVPADPQRDSDLLIGAGLEAGDELLAEVERMRALLDGPCGSCHPCDNYRDETWREAGRKPPHVHEWDEVNGELEALRLKYDALLGLSKEASDKQWERIRAAEAEVARLLAENERLDRDLLTAQGQLADAREAGRG